MRCGFTLDVRTRGDKDYRDPDSGGAVCFCCFHQIQVRFGRR